MLDGLGPAIHQYARGLGYTLMLNALGFRYLYKAWTQDLYVLRDTTQVLRWFLVAVGVALQIPGLLYLWVGWWSASQIAPTSRARTRTERGLAGPRSGAA